MSDDCTLVYITIMDYRFSGVILFFNIITLGKDDNLEGVILFRDTGHRYLQAAFCTVRHEVTDVRAVDARPNKGVHVVVVHLPHLDLEQAQQANISPIRDSNQAR